MTSVARRREQNDSGEFSDTSQEIEQNNSGNLLKVADRLQDGVQNESDYDSQGSDSDRSERDPDNQETERRVDDDEDRSNPQYIPKRGTFYEHDDRTAATLEESAKTTSDTVSEKKEGSEAPTERRRPPRKSDTVNKWSHDKYNENEQVPKSREELVAIYGYDIRNEDAPPHARRNRRYGRGPNKYTRTWEDEEAYRRQTAALTPHRKPPNPEEFPELDAPGKKFSKKSRAPRPRSKSQPASTDSSEKGSQLRRNASIKTPKTKQTPKPSFPKQNTLNRSNVRSNEQKISAKEKLPPIENLTITALVNNNDQQQQAPRRVSAAVAQQRPVPTELAKKKMNNSLPPQQNNVPTSKPVTQQQLPQQQPKPQQQQAQQTQQQPAGGESRGGSKRYSSLRQRPLAESYAPNQQQQQPSAPQQQPTPQQQKSQPVPQQQQQQVSQQQPHRYHGDYPGNAPPPSQHQGSPVPQLHPQQLIHQVHRNPPVNQPHGPSPPHQALQPQQQQQQQQQQQHSQQVRLGILETPPQMVSHPHHSMHNMPPQHSIGQLQPAQGYAPPAMMPAQYMQQSGTGAVYGGAMFAQPPAAYPHQLYQHHNYATQAGGVTYYNCAEQEPPQPQPRAQRRPTAAIPIVRPAPPERPANSSEKDNIDRIVENMFVRKPWPAHGSEASKEKLQENRSSQEPQSKESSQPNSLSSSYISTDSKPGDNMQKEAEESKPEKEVQDKEVIANPESITTDA